MELGQISRDILDEPKPRMPVLQVASCRDSQDVPNPASVSLLLFIFRMQMPGMDPNLGLERQGQGRKLCWEKGIFGSVKRGQKTKINRKKGIVHGSGSSGMGSPNPSGKKKKIKWDIRVKIAGKPCNSKISHPILLTGFPAGWGRSQQRQEVKEKEGKSEDSRS